MIEIREVLRRRMAGQGLREIERDTGINRKTVRRYVEAATECGATCEEGVTDELVHEVARRVQARPLPPPSEQREMLATQHEQLSEWLAIGKDKRGLRLAKVHVLLERRGICTSYSTLRRFAIQELGWGKREATVRVDDSEPGQEAQVDFGRMGRMVDVQSERERTLWALIVTLTFSRYMFVWPAFEQTLEVVCAGLDEAWRFFGGMAHRIVPDNMKAIVLRADPQSPVFNESFLEYAQARDLFIDPARVRRAKDKARVENQVPYVRESWFEGEQFRCLAETRDRALEWCRDVAGQRVHGTTRKLPRAQYEEVERARMKPAPTTPFDVPTWGKAKVHPDHHIQFARALYSVPTHYLGRQVRVRGDRSTVRIYLNTELIKVHPRKAPGGRSTDKNDYPVGKAPYATRSVEQLIEAGHRNGPDIGTYMERLLDGPLPWTRMRQAYGLLRLCTKYGNASVQDACKRGLAFDVVDVPRIERMLKGAIREQEQAVRGGKVVPLHPPRFARDVGSFAMRATTEETDDEGGPR